MCGGLSLSLGARSFSLPLLFRSEVVPEDGEVLSELVPVLGLQCAANVVHEFLKASGEALLLLSGLRRDDLHLQISVNLLVQENEGEHGAAEAPLVRAVFEEDDLEEGLENARKDLRIFLNVRHKCLRGLGLRLPIDDIVEVEGGEAVDCGGALRRDRHVKTLHPGLEARADVKEGRGVPRHQKCGVVVRQDLWWWEIKMRTSHAENETEVSVAKASWGRKEFFVRRYPPR